MNNADKHGTSPLGILMPIGGAEDKVQQKIVLRHFVQLAGDNNASIVIIPSASAFAVQTGAIYTNLFEAMGVRDVTCLHVEKPQEALNPNNIERLRNASGIFISGGDQMRLMAYIQGTEVRQAILDAYVAGACVGGTSAGASIMSHEMIAFGYSGMEPPQQMIYLTRGLGLAPSLIIDQHFSQRKRLGRLQMAVEKHPQLVGLGVDEDTAAILTADGCAEVLGSGTVTMVYRPTPEQKSFVQVWRQGHSYSVCPPVSIQSMLAAKSS